MSPQRPPQGGNQHQGRSVTRETQHWSCEDGRTGDHRVGAHSAINGIKQAGKADLVKGGGINMDETILNNIKAGGQIFLTASGFSNWLNVAAGIGGVLLTGPRQLNMGKAEQT